MELDDLRHGLLAAADADKAVEMAAYTKNQFAYLGCTAGERRTVSKPILQVAKQMEPNALLDLVTTLWAQSEREFHYVGMDAVRAGAKHLRPIDLDTVKSLILATPWWDTVDSLAIHTVGTLVKNHPDLVHVMDDWIESADDTDEMWLCRTAILHQLMYRENTDVNRLFTYCTMTMDSSEFFIRKAIGWALRQYARTNPEAVLAFVEDHDESLSGLSKREALKHLR